MSARTLVYASTYAVYSGVHWLGVCAHWLPLTTCQFTRGMSPGASSLSLSLAQPLFSSLLCLLTLYHSIDPLTVQFGYSRQAALKA